MTTAQRSIYRMAYFIGLLDYLTAKESKNAMRLCRVPDLGHFSNEAIKWHGQTTGKEAGKTYLELRA